MEDKSQITNNKIQTNPNNQNSNVQNKFGLWIFGFRYCLLFGACNLEFVCLALLTLYQNRIENLDEL